jgi:exodeoxyribonuclease V gamma subunit
MLLSWDEAATSDDEPFLPDFRSRQALAERLLPQALQGLSAQQLRRLAEAGIEYPPGTFGTVLLNDEMDSLQRFARTVREATQAPCLPPLNIDLPFVLEGEDWQLATVLAGRRKLMQQQADDAERAEQQRHPAGLLLHRYDDTRPVDYLSAWLTHLAAAAAQPGTMQTQWISRDGSFRLTHCPDARSILEGLMSLYRRGLREPIHFFPKSAWAYIQSRRDLAAALKKWHNTFTPAHGEDADPAYRLALRGVADPLDADFRACAESVFGAMGAYLEDSRL